MASRWDQVEPIMREQAYRAIENDPQVLLEHDGGPYGVHAEVIFARLYGLDDEIVRDGWRLPRIEAALRLPIIPRLRISAEPVRLEPVGRVATYVLQSGYALQTVDAMNGPPDVPLLPDFRVRVLYLRYRRRV